MSGDGFSKYERRNAYPSNLPKIRGGVESVAIGIYEGIRGAISRLSLRRTIAVSPVPPEIADTLATASDWETVGSDMYDAMGIVKGE